MGGLYARYALKDINWVVHARNGSYGIKKVVFPNLFVTIATPHLGVKNMLYIAIPQFLENFIARILGQSGRDLFRQRKVDASKQNRWLGWKSQDKTGEDGEKLKTSAYNDIIEEMSIDAKFLLPLSRFSKRVAYANAYGTDIAVSTATAAFLVDDNDTNAENISDSQSETIGKDHRLPSACFSDSKVSSHMLVDDHSHDRQMVIDHCIHKSFEKKRKKMNLSTVSFETKGNLRKFQANETHQGKQYLSVSEMARSLDSLGWRKVFVDLRPHVPSLWRRPDDKRDNLVNQFDESSTNLQQYDEQVQQPRGSFFSSSDLKRRLSGNGSDGWLPFGHSFIVASERDPIHRLLCKKVRPLVDDVIAEPLMRDILSPLEQGGAVARNCLKGE